MTHSYISTLFCLAFFGIVLRMEISQKRNLDLGDIFVLPMVQSSLGSLPLVLLFQPYKYLGGSSQLRPASSQKEKRKLHVTASSSADFFLIQRVLILMLEVQGASNCLSCLFVFMPMFFFFFIINKEVMLCQEAPGFDATLSGSQRIRERFHLADAIPFLVIQIVLP